MASATSDPSKVSIFTGNSQQRRSGKGPRDVNYYKSEVTRLGDGSVKRETYRTDAQGNNTVKIQEVVSKDGKETSNTILSTASAGERRGLKDPSSRLASSVKTQTGNANKKMVENETEAAAGGQTSIGKKNAEIIAGGSGNNANDEGEAGDTSRPSGEPPKNRAKTRDKFGDMNYPIDREQLQDIIKFDMLKYKPKKVEAFSFGDREEKGRETLGSVTLPIPGGISDSNGCDWGGDTMNPLQIAGAGLALAALQNSKNVPGGLSGALSGLVDSVRDNNAVIKDGIAGGTAAAAVGANINSILGRTQGMILNPNLELLFQKPSLRPFTFQFKMSPRSKGEAEEILKIIRFFKQGMAPIREQSRLFLKTPHTFKIKYVQLGEESKFLNKFKECALLSCSVQYTPEGNYAPYEDGAMSSYQMSLQFKELEPVFNDDYGSDGDLPAEIGF